MIRINLLPFRAARKKENIRRQISIFLLTFIFTSIVLAYYNGVLKNEVVKLENNIAGVKTEIVKYRKSIQEIRRIKKALKTLNNKLNIINRLQTNRKWPITLLDSINLLVVEKRMWLTSISSKGPKIVIKGIALDNKTVADFMTRLEKSNLYTAVNLQTVSRKKVLKYNLKSFSVTFKKKPKKKPKKKSTRARAKK